MNELVYTHCIFIRCGSIYGKIYIAFLLQQLILQFQLQNQYRWIHITMKRDNIGQNENQTQLQKSSHSNREYYLMSTDYIELILHFITMENQT